MTVFDDSKSSKPHEIYEVFRSYCRHEDSLVSSRLSWNLTVQGFLFAGYCLLAQKAFEVCAGGKAETAPFTSLRLTMWVIAALGTLISAASQAGVWAANMAIGKVCKHWQKTLFRNPELTDLFPDLTGGGARRARILGNIPQWLPLLIILIWVGIVFASLGLTSCPAAPKSSPPSCAPSQVVETPKKPQTR